MDKTNQEADTLLPTFVELLKKNPGFFDEGLTAKEAARLIDSTPAALAQMRCRSTGPAYHRLPTDAPIDRRDRPRGPIRYMRRDVIEWLYAQPRFINTTQEVIAGANGIE